MNSHTIAVSNQLNLVPFRSDPDIGFIVDVFSHRRDTGTVVCLVGRLADGDTFAIVDDRERPSFFIRVSDAEAAGNECAKQGCEMLPTKLSTMDGEAVLEIAADAPPTLRRLASTLEEGGVRTYEADYAFHSRFLLERGIRGSVRIRGAWEPADGVSRLYRNPELGPAEHEPDLTLLSLDIETDRDAEAIYGVSLVGDGPGMTGLEQMLVVGQPAPTDPASVVCFATEKALLEGLAARIRELDPDIVTGWNVIDFDLAVLQRLFKRHGVAFQLGRTKTASWYRGGDRWGGSRMTIPGRQVLDALHLMRSSLHRFDDWRLDTVAREVLGRGKALSADDEGDMPAAIVRAYEEDRAAFADYCLEDARLVRDLLEKTDLLRLTLSRSRLVGLPLQRAWSSVAAFEFLYLGELRRRGLVAPSMDVDREGGVGAPGGLVFAPQPGLYRHVIVFDFKSLYPSIIRTFNIDPLAAAQACDEKKPIRAPNGVEFHRRAAILPGLLDRFFTRRDEAKAAGNELASFTYKLVMNSFYGVLGTGASRFGTSRLAGAVTSFAHMIMNWTRDWLSARDLQVIYGDTDSLFVVSDLPATAPPETVNALGRGLCRDINTALAAHVAAQYDVVPRLELEFEKHYSRFLMPSSRGDAERGRAKGYAGLRVTATGDALEIVGMEAVRRDWTELAHKVQRELLALVFADSPRAALESYVADVVAAVRAGERDADLVYLKGLRKGVDAYTRTTPPHVKAARLLPNPGGVIRYVVTVDGPQPIGHVTAGLDYDHYVSRQIAPIVQTIAALADFNAESALTGQRLLF